MKTSKFLAMMLAIALVVSLVPAITTTAGAEVSLDGTIQGTKLADAVKDHFTVTVEEYSSYPYVEDEVIIFIVTYTYNGTEDLTSSNMGGGTMKLHL